MKQVIFIAGTAYSGSSMLDMMIGNSDSSFSTGEVQFLFNPIELHQINPPCGCGNTSCNIWHTIKKSGEHDFYDDIFNRFDGIQNIIDSSKDPLWINQQQISLNNRGIKSRVILIWKKPEEFATSRLKRDALEGWQHAWLNYHKLFFSLIKNWNSVMYRDLATQPALKLKQICDTLAIPYEDKMENYWGKQHHMLFGNTSARYHMYKKNANQYKTSVDNLHRVERKFDNNKLKIEKKHRTISYDSDFQDNLPSSVSSISKNKTFSNVIKAIQSRDVGLNIHNDISKPHYKELEFPRMVIELYRAKRVIKQSLFYFRNRKKMSSNS